MYVIIKVAKIDKQKADTWRIERNTLVFLVAEAITIQPEEVVGVPSNLVLDLPADKIISIFSSPTLAAKGGYIWPVPVVLEQSIAKKPLYFPLCNKGRVGISLLPGDPVAVGYVSTIEFPEIEIFDQGSEDLRFPKTVPQRKNPGNFRFDLR